MTTPPVRINPSTWNDVFRFDQAQLRPAPSRLLTLAGQGPVGPDGLPRYEGDMAAQITLVMDNIEELLTAGGMTWRDVLRLTIYVTDMDAALAAYSSITDRLDAAGASPPCTLVAVVRLAIPEMMVEITVDAGR